MFDIALNVWMHEQKQGTCSTQIKKSNMEWDSQVSCDDITVFDSRKKIEVVSKTHIL